MLLHVAHKERRRAGRKVPAPSNARSRGMRAEGVLSSKGPPGSRSAAFAFWISRCWQAQEHDSRNGTYGILARSLRLDIGRPNDLCPFFGLVGNELGKVGGRAPKRYAAKFGKPCLRRGIGKHRINPMVELINNLRGCGLGKANA